MNFHTIYKFTPSNGGLTTQLQVVESMPHFGVEYDGQDILVQSVLENMILFIEELRDESLS
jgi:hypothetical protein